MKAMRPSFLYLVLLLSIVVAPGLAAAEKPGLPRESLPERPPPVVSPAELHPEAAGDAVSGAPAVAVDFAAAVALSAAAEPPVGLQFHIQGELPGDQEEPVDTEPPPANAPAEEGHPPPATAEPGLAQAPGDSVASFAGLANTGWIPPDTVLAVGPSSVLEAVNSGFAVYSKAGGTLSGYTTFSSFFAPLLPVGWGGSLFDPRVSYSPEHGKFAMLALGIDRVLQESYLFLAISQTSDPTGLWWTYRYAVDAANAADADAWMDYCGLGADTWGLYVTCNLFRWTGSFKYSQVWTLGPQHFSGGVGSGWVFWDLRWNDNSSAYSLQPTTPYSSAADAATFLVNTFSSSGNRVLLWKLTGDRTNAPTLSRATISTATYEAIGENVDQPGSSSDIDGGDARIMNAAYAHRRVYAVLTHDVDNNGRRAGWRLYQFDVDANSLPWQTLITTPTTASTGGFYYFYPAITLDGYGGTAPNIAIFGSWTDSETTLTSTTNFASALVKIFSDPPNDTGPFLSYSSGSAAYVRRDSGGRNRWGDYSGAAFDWSTGNVWGAAEVAGTSNTWRTQITGLTISDGCGPDGFEPDGTSGQASTLNSGIAQARNLCPTGDVDWARFTLAGEAAIELATSGPSGDTELWLYDDQLSQIDYDDDGGVGLFSRIDRTCGVDALPAGTYYARVGEFGSNAEIASYSLLFTRTSGCCASSLTLANTTLSGTATYQAVDVTLGPNLTVAGSDIRVVAGNRVTFVSGTKIGGKFSAGVDSLACSSSPTGGNETSPGD
jgi:hypothetical protein